MIETLPLKLIEPLIFKHPDACIKGVVFVSFFL